MLSALRERLARVSHGSSLQSLEKTPGSPPNEDAKSPSEAVDSASTDDRPDEQAQHGVQVAEAITLSWTKTSLACAYILMFLLYFVNAFQSQITSNLGAYVTSGFEAHSLIPVISVVSSVMSAAAYMPIAKLLNIWDRSAGFLLMASFATLGLILSATCKSIAVYCAAQVFYSIGFTGVIFSVDVITTDSSSLRDRGLAFAFTSSPYMITAFAGPKAAEGFYDTNWRWGYGVWTIVLPIVALPLFGLLQYHKQRAKKQGLLPEKRQSGRTLVQSLWFYIVEFDLLGVILLAGGLAMFLLPFNLAASSADSWQTPHIIILLVIGFCCLIAFFVVERFIAPAPFLPWNILASRNVLGACLLSANYQIAYYCWASYFTSFLQVVFNTSISSAGYINSTFDVVSGFWLFVVGFLIKKTGRFRWLLHIAVPLYILGAGLMIYFRRPGMSVGYVIMCQIFIAFAGGTMIICQQVSVLAAADHNNAAASLAMLGVFGNIGGGIGNSISGAIWTNTLPKALQRLLPESAQADWESIYDSLDVQLSYPIGDPVRSAIQEAYGIAQSRMLIAGVAIMGLSLVWMFVVKNLSVNRAQTKGVLF